MAELDNKVALVTGSGRGIGKAAAVELARRGAKVALTARTTSEVEETLTELRQVGATAIALTADLSQGQTAVQQVVDSVRSQLGPVDILINNAALLGPFGPTWETDPTEWTRAIEVNVTAPYLLTRAVLNDMRERGWGRIINVSSGAARNPMDRAGAYSTTKAALDMFTRQLGVELEGSGVVAISVYPGIVDTNMQTAVRQQPVEKIGVAFSERFHSFYNEGQLQPTERPGRLLAILSGPVGANLNGQIVEIYDPTYQAMLNA